jgi:hypothetical protein
MYVNLPLMCLLYVSGINRNWDVLTNFVKKKTNQVLTQIHPAKICSIKTD